MKERIDDGNINCIIPKVETIDSDDLYRRPEICIARLQKKLFRCKREIKLNFQFKALDGRQE